MNNRSFIDKCLVVLGKALNEFLRAHLNASDLPPPADPDPRELLKIMDKNWMREGALRFVRRSDSRKIRSIVNEIIADGDKHAHFRPFSDNDIARFVDSAEKLLNAINADSAAAELGKIYAAFISETKPKHSASDLKRAARRAHSIVGAMKVEPHHVAADVVGKKVFCPLCDKKIFASWPLGWDAHAAHKCSGIRASSHQDRKTEYKRRTARLFRN